MKRAELVDLLPLHAGGDLDPADRARVDEALAGAPELADEAAEWAALDAELRAAFGPLEREDLVELVPLLAAGDLDPDLAGQVEAGLAEHPELRSEQVGYDELEGLLADAFAGAPGQEGVVVRVRCPFCHDALAGELVRCAGCATPHHAACWGQNQGCSLLGCLSTRSVAADAPDQRTCVECGEQTPAAAPFCAWCAQPLDSDEGVPLSARPSTRVAAEDPKAAPAEDAEPAEPARVIRFGQGWRFAAAAALLLVSGLSIGAAFGLQQRTLFEEVALADLRPQLQQAERELPRLAVELGRAQALYRELDLDGNGRSDYAPDLEALQAGLEQLDPERRGRELPRLSLGGWDAWAELQVGRGDGRFYALAACRFATEERPAGAWSWFVDDEGGAPRWLPERFELDPEACTVRGLELDPVEALLARYGRALSELPAVECVSGADDALRVHVASGAALATRELPLALLAELADGGLGLELATDGSRRGYWGEDLGALAVEAVRDRHLDALREVPGLDAVSVSGRRLELVAASPGVRDLVRDALPPPLRRDLDLARGRLSISADQDPDLAPEAILARYRAALVADPEIEDVYVMDYGPTYTASLPSQRISGAQYAVILVGPGSMDAVAKRLPAGLLAELEEGGHGWGVGLPQDELGGGR